jgi:tetratricopeptide (TPR) repeat protein
MGKDDWFRRSTWTDRDRNEFHARLKRCRAVSNKSQFLRIQAEYLASAGLHLEAIELLDRLFEEYPERIQLAQAHLQRARSSVSLGQLDRALIEFRASLQAERDFPNVRTNAWLDFGMFVVERELTDLYDEALSVLKEFRVNLGLSFPAFEYRFWAIQAVIAGSKREMDSAGRFALLAFAEAEKVHSGLRYHAKLGLVSSQPEWLERKLRAIVSGKL